MGSHDVHEELPAASTPAALPGPDTAQVIAAVRALLQRRKPPEDPAPVDTMPYLEDPTDRTIIEETVRYLEAPTGKLSDIMSHTQNIGDVLAGFAQQSGDLDAKGPPEVEALHADFFALQCRCCLDVARAELEKDVPLSETVEFHMFRALSSAHGYENQQLLAEVAVTRERISQQPRKRIAMDGTLSGE